MISSDRLLPGVLQALRGELVVSCQANPGSPLRRPEIMAAMAQAAELGGAAGIRLQGFDDAAAIRAVTALPLIGLTKTDRPDTDIYITPTSAEAVRLADLGCEIVAIDATLRPRPEPFAQMVARVHAAGALVMADISTFAEAQQAMQDGADIVSTTLSGYTPYSRQQEGPDWELMRELHAQQLPFSAEGRLSSPDDAAKALAHGAAFVVIGSAITRPDVVTGWYVNALKKES
ncbi:N-acetylmannosamine-6-phosphate 2-epimerase [Deinococcus ruber]|uniref:Putative N-acetylmannosamine-6-phosphate 2-epimerase n=1 Tax=Deinococcus ruber TaxID=1848197 RepID=A0A918F4I7_9DEIO|nr:N-acetylmannosamine-6-phosphate 2-epimerase [Deinococcus ruber]GGR07980.1 putative N-acetylmannosamine-6-phosphate 2-epimerase [Deinococcus ruber]